MNFWKKITKKQARHLRLMGVTTVGQFKAVRELQETRRREADEEGLPPGIAEPCFECVEIERRVNGK